MFNIMRRRYGTARYERDTTLFFNGEQTFVFSSILKKPMRGGDMKNLHTLFSEQGSEAFKVVMHVNLFCT